MNSLFIHTAIGSKAIKEIFSFFNQTKVIFIQNVTTAGIHAFCEDGCI